MAVYPLKKWGRNLGVLFLVLGGAQLVWMVTRGPSSLDDILSAGIGLLFAGVFVLSMRLRVGADRYSSDMLGFSRGARFSDITKLGLYAQPFSGGKTLNLVVAFERDGREGNRRVGKINQYENYEQFLRELEMFSGKKVEKF